jgi:hypothetical protein
MGYAVTLGTGTALYSGAGPSMSRTSCRVTRQCPRACWDRCRRDRDATCPARAVAELAVFVGADKLRESFPRRPALVILADRRFTAETSSRESFPRRPALAILADRRFTADSSYFLHQQRYLRCAVVGFPCDFVKLTGVARSHAVHAPLGRALALNCFRCTSAVRSRPVRRPGNGPCFTSRARQRGSQRGAPQRRAAPPARRCGGAPCSHG